MATTLPPPAPPASTGLRGQAEPAARWRRLASPAGLAVAGLLAAAALHARDPHTAGSWGWCPWLVLTGTSCPGCGGLRAVHDLTEGDLRAALSSNALAVLSLPLLALWWLRATVQAWSGVRRPLAASLVRPAGVAALVTVVAFGVLRNLPAGAWLAP